MTSLHQPRETTLAEVLQAIEDVELTPRFRDYRIDPLNQLVPLRRARVLRENYEWRFEEPYVDGEAFPHNPMPDWMISAIFRLGAALLDFMITVTADSKMPQITCYDVLTPRREELKAAGYEALKLPYSEEYRCEILAVRTKYGLVWLPLDNLVSWMRECDDAERLQLQA